MPKRRLSVRTPSRGPGPTTREDESHSSSTQMARDNVRVVVRVRPMNEQEHQSSSIIHVLDSNVLIFDPKPQDSPGSYFRGRRRRQRDLLKRKNRDLKFAFDHVFDGEKSQEYVYRNTTKSVVDSVVNGFNASVFAYGATGAGKTHTMLGGPGSPGVIYLTMTELYQKINAIQNEKTCNVTISYLEVYNETIRDLIRPSGPLAIREDPQKGVLVSGLSVHKPKDADELFQMLETGNSNRTQHPTDANKQSSRSHAVFQVFVRQKDRATGLKADVRVAKMSLIDLAGSERATVTSNKGARFREGANINKSLLALGNCINALAESKSKRHIPYRNSKLTRLLKDSLGGNCKTVMIAAISPSSNTYEDTYNTLRYANRTKDIQTSLKRNVVSVNYHVTQYAKIVEDLKAENAELKAKLLHQQQQSQRVPTAVSGMGADVQTLRNRAEFDRIFSQRFQIRKELLDIESTDRNLAAKIVRKEMLTERLNVLHGSTSLGDKTISKNHKNIATTRKRQDRLKERKRTIEKRRQENQAALQRLSGEATNSGGDRGMGTPFGDYLRSRQMEGEIRDSRRLIQHMKQFSRFQEGHIKASETLMGTLLSVVRRQYYLIKGSGLATDAVHSDFEMVQRGVEGTTEVLWADQSQLDESLMNQTVDDGSLNYLLGLPVQCCEIQSPHGPSPRKLRRLTFSQSGAGSPLPKQEASQAESSPMATPLAASPLTALPEVPATPLTALPEVPVTPVDTRVQQKSRATPSAITRSAIKREPLTLVTPRNTNAGTADTNATPVPSFAQVVGTPALEGTPTVKTTQARQNTPAVKRTPAVEATPVANLPRSPFVPLSTNSPNLGRGPGKVKLGRPAGFEQVAKQGYGNTRTPQHGKVKRVSKDREKKPVVNHPYRRQSLGPPSRKNSEYLQKYGIPSMLDSTSSSKSSTKKPAYMSLTKSAASKQKNALDRRRTVSLRSAGPQRVATKTNSSSNVQSVTTGPSGGWKL